MHKHFNIVFRLLIILVICPTVSVAERHAPFFASGGGDRAYIKHLIEEAQKIQKENPKKAIEYLESALELSIRTKDTENEYICYKILGELNYQVGLYPQAITYFKRITERTEKIAFDDQKRLEKEEADQPKKKSKDFRFESKASNGYITSINWNEVNLQLGKAYLANQNYDESINSFQAYIKTTQEQGAQLGIAEGYYFAGQAQEKKLKWDDAIHSYETALSIYKELSQTEKTFNCLLSLGNCWFSKGNNQQAILYYQQAKGIAEEEKNAAHLSTVTDHLSEIYRKEKKYEEELRLRENSLKQNTINKNLDIVNKEYYEIASVYTQLEKTEKAINYLNQSINLSATRGDLFEKARSLAALSALFEKQGQPQKALEVYKKYYALSDSIHRLNLNKALLSEATNNSLLAVQQKIDLLQREKDLDNKTIDLLTKDREINAKSMRAQQMVIYALISCLLISLVASFFIIRSVRQKRLANQILLLKSLRTQMNPHFIFNALNSVNNFILLNDERSANTYLSSFSKLMRSVMEVSEHNFISLSKEADMLSIYLSLEHLRFGDKFDYTFEIDPLLDREGLFVPPMLIQPYIENAIWHGLRYKEQKGQLDVKIEHQENNIIIWIQDNGIGRKRSEEIKTHNQRKNNSTAMKNIEKRLQLIKEVFRISIQIVISDLDVQEKSGTIVKIVIPFNLSASHA